MILGSHVKMKAPDYFTGAVQEALSYRADALMLYTGAPQNTRRTDTARMKIEEGQEMLRKAGIPLSHVIVHAPYIINPANRTDAATASFAVEFLYREIQRTAALGAELLVLHPGSWTVTDPETGIRSAAESLNRLGDYPEPVTVCLETMAGKGTELGSSFEELAQILEKLNHPGHYGICLDTCHIHDAGYDVMDFDAVLDEFERVIGMDHLKVIHLNDSKNVRGARKDRHANIGKGEIGFDALYRIAHNARTAHLVRILETPYIKEQAPYGIEIDMLRSGVYEEERLSF